MKRIALWDELKTLIRDERRVRNQLNLIQDTGIATTPKEHKQEVRRASIAIHFHIFHEKYIRKLENAIKNFPDSLILISVPDQNMSDLISIRLVKYIKKQEVKILVVENEGRNFGPLIKHFSASILKKDFLIHVHSKDSNGSVYRGMWARILWNELVLNKESVARNLEIMTRENSGILFPFSIRWMPQYFSWLGNYELAKEILPEIVENSFPKDQIIFPIGGMFFARVKSIEPILVSMPLREAFIPESDNQLAMSKGVTAEHVVERALGLMPTKSGYESYVVITESRMCLNPVQLLKSLS